MKEIYFDNSATTPVLKEVAEIMYENMLLNFGNPSSLHKRGMLAEKALKTAREQMAKAMKVSSDEIYFTSCGTEGDNLAIKGIAHAFQKRGKHIITSQIEHPAVLESMKQLEQEGFNITYLPVNSYGQISLEELEKAITPETILVSLMYVNNEVGTILPLEKVGELLSKQDHKIYFHIDAVQAFGKIPVLPNKLKADLVAISGHKIHGPKGIGVLYVRKNTRLIPILNGGGQEKALRSGTENMPGIVGIGLATEMAMADMEENRKNVIAIRDAFLNAIEGKISFVLNTNLEESLPNILNISFIGAKSEVLLHSFEAKGLYVSSGSACSSHDKRGSHVLVAMGKDNKVLDSSIRFSFSGYNTVEEAEKAGKIVVEEVENLLRILGGMR